MRPSTVYFKLFLSGAKQELSNGYVLVARSSLMIVLLWVYCHLWKIVADTTPGQPYPYENYVWYIAITEWVMITVPYFYLSIEEDIKDEKIFSALLRPTNYLLQKIAECIGIISVRIVCLGLVAFATALLLTGKFIFNPAESAAITVSIFFATIVVMLMQGIIGIFSITLKDSSPLYWIWQKAFFILGCLLVPLFMYPAWLMKITKFTPFYPILGGIGQTAFHQGDLLTSACNLGIIVIWLVIFSFVISLVYQRGIHLLLKGDA